MARHDFSLYNSNGYPDLELVRANFPTHGNGEITHRNASGDEFVFNLVRHGDGYDAVIVKQPAYGLWRDSSLHATHRLPAGNRHKICFKKAPEDLPKAIAFALWWADCTSRYIRDGKSWS